MLVRCFRGGVELVQCGCLGWREGSGWWDGVEPWRVSYDLSLWPARRQRECHSQSMESITMILVNSPSLRPRKTLYVSVDVDEPQRNLRDKLSTYFKMVSVWSLKALLILADLSAENPSGLR